MPCTNIDTYDNRDEGHSVIETRTVVCWFWMNPNKHEDDQGDDQRRQRTRDEEPVVETVFNDELGDGYGPAKNAANNDIEETMHATIQPAKHDGDGEPVAEQLECQEYVRVIVVTCGVALVEGIQGDGDGVARVRRGEAVLEGS